MATTADETATATNEQEKRKPVMKVVTTAGVGQFKELGSPVGYDKEVEEQGANGFKAAKYPNYLPTWNPEQKYPPLQPFEHHDPGRDADKTFPDLFHPGVKATELTPTIGTEIEGVQISSLSNAGKDQLALLVAQRKVVVFRNQDFADLPIANALAFGEYFGRLHIHPTLPSPAGFPEIHLAHRGAGDRSFETFFQQRISSVAWHSDVSFEAQPPGTTFLYILDQPRSGGDTVFADTVEAYNRLSPAFQERLHGLKVSHSSVQQVEASRSKGGIVRREPVTNAHPIVRTHPVTEEKALFVNPHFTQGIVGYKKEESDNLLKFLYDHIANGADFQVRIKWEDATVVVLDNRVCMHTALVDWYTGERRHIARVTPQAERPFETSPIEGHGAEKE